MFVWILKILKRFSEYWDDKFNTLNEFLAHTIVILIDFKMCHWYNTVIHVLRRNTMIKLSLSGILNFTWFWSKIAFLWFLFAVGVQKRFLFERHSLIIVRFEYFCAFANQLSFKKWMSFVIHFLCYINTVFKHKKVGKLDCTFSLGCRYIRVALRTTPSRPTAR